MKKIFLAFAVFALVMASCKEEAAGPQEEAYVEFSISANQADYTNLKAGSLDDVVPPECSDRDIVYTHAKIMYEVWTVGDQPQLLYGNSPDGYFDVDVHVLVENGRIVTQPVKVPMGDEPSVSIKILEFLMYDGVQLVKATPHVDSEFEDYINPNYGLRTFVLDKFNKEEFRIDVLCYEDVVYDYFGFLWFDIRPITVRGICVFGDICICDPDMYARATYEYGDDESFSYWPQIEGKSLADVVAGIRVTIMDNTGVEKVFNNLDDVNNCLEVTWSDYDDEDEDITFTLQVLLPVTPTQLAWVTVREIEVNANGSEFGLGQDGVLDFVIGDCHPNADWIIDGEIVLPGDDVLGIKMNAEDMAFSNEYLAKYSFMGIPEGYSVVNDVNYYGWCVNYGIPFPEGSTGDITFLKAGDFDGTIASNYINEGMVDSITWLINNNTDIFDNGMPKPDMGKIIQLVIWKICGTDIINEIGGVLFTEDHIDEAIAIYNNMNVPLGYDAEAGVYQVVGARSDETVQILVTKMSAPCVEVFVDDYDEVD